MSVEAKPGKTDSAAQPKRELQPPGLLAIGFYLLMVAGVIVAGVVDGGHYPPLFLLFSPALIAACAGLLLGLRWAWAMALAAVVLLAGYHLWFFASVRFTPSLVQGLLNLVFVFYLIRPELRARLR